MNNIETLTYIAERNNMTLTDFVFGYLVNDEFKEAVDVCLDDINSRRIPNGLEKLEINFSVVGACSE
jgi:hypothetical protein